MEDNRIPDSSLSASSADSPDRASHGRLNEVGTSPGGGGWSANDTTDPWFEIDFGSTVTISQIATQGHHSYDEWLRTYGISIRSNSDSFVLYNNNKVSSRLCFYI